MFEEKELYVRDSDEIFNICYNYNEEPIEYMEYTSKVFESTIRQENGVFYMLPRWRIILSQLNLSPEFCEDIIDIGGTKININVTWETIKEMIQLEVERCNRMYSPINTISTLLKSVSEKIIEDDSLNELIKAYTDKENIPS